MYWTYNFKEKVVYSILFAYKPLNKTTFFFQEISNNLNQVVKKCGNIFLAGELNIDLLYSNSDPNKHFSVLRDKYDLTNLVKAPA